MCSSRQETFEDLAWEVTLKPNEWVVVGAYVDDAESLGAQCFAQEDDQARVQRLLTEQKRVARESIEDRNWSQTLLAGEKRLLEMIASGSPLLDVLNA